MTILDELQKEPWRFGFYQAIRRLNCEFKDKALTGQSVRPSEDPVRFGQTPHTSFAPSTLSQLEYRQGDGAPWLTQYFLGVFGPNGPLPLHITEYARDRKRHHQDDTLANFADMFHHRIVSLFYRAWAQAQPTVQRDRPGEDRFSMYIGALIGLGMPSLANGDAMPHEAKLHFAGHLGSLPRHTEGLTSLLRGLLGVPVQIVEFVAHWLKIPRRDRFVLGTARDIGRLGESCVIGERVWQRQDKFQIRLGPMNLEEYESFLPTGTSFKAMLAAVRNYLGPEWLWEVNLRLEGEQKPVTCLGKQGALGWTTWLQTEHPRKEVADLVLQIESYTREATLQPA